VRSPPHHRSSTLPAARPRQNSTSTAAMHTRTPDKTTSTSHPTSIPPSPRRYLSSSSTRAATDRAQPIRPAPPPISPSFPAFTPRFPLPFFP